MNRLILAAVLALPTTPALAQVVTPCARDFAAQAQNITEPWEQNIRSFANGAVRIALMDTVEPAGTPFHLLVISPPRDELGSRQCRLISAAAGAGFAAMDLAGLAARYDPARGLVLDLPVARFDARSTDLPTPYRLTIAIDQSTGDIATDLGPAD